MSAETDLFAAISSYPDVSALVAARVFPDAMPEKTAYPAVVYSRGDTEYLYTLHCERYAEQGTMAVSAWGRSRTEADAVADAIEAALDAAGIELAGRTAGYDESLGLFGADLTAVLYIT